MQNQGTLLVPPERVAQHRTSRITRTRAEFIQSLKELDEDAWNRFHRVYVPTIRKLCFWAIGGATNDQVDEIQQNVLAKLVKYIGNYEHRGEHVGSFRKYLRMITRTEISNYFKQDTRLPPNLRRLRRLFGDEFFERFDFEATTTVIANLRQNSKISDDGWRAFHEYLADHELTYATVANCIGKSPEAVRKQVSRIVERIKAELGD